MYLFVLTIPWLASNAFSTSRWQPIPLACSSIPSDAFMLRPCDFPLWCWVRATRISHVNALVAAMRKLSGLWSGSYLPSVRTLISILLAPTEDNFISCKNICRGLHAALRRTRVPPRALVHLGQRQFLSWQGDHNRSLREGRQPLRQIPVRLWSSLPVITLAYGRIADELVIVVLDCGWSRWRRPRCESE